MAEPNPPENLSNHHLRTLETVFEHPVSHNLQWPHVVALLSALGNVEERRDGKLAVAIGDATQVFERPPGKDLTADQVLDLRRLLLAAGLGPVDRSDVVPSS